MTGGLTCNSEAGSHCAPQQCEASALTPRSRPLAGSVRFVQRLASGTHRGVRLPMRIRQLLQWHADRRGRETQQVCFWQARRDPKLTYCSGIGHSTSGLRRCRTASWGPTMGLSKNGKPCIDVSALVAAVTSENTTHAWPRSRYVRMHTTSRILPNWEKMAYRHFLSSARW